MRMDPFGTHQALLAAVVAATRGTILELGGGWYSTALISALIHGTDRQAITVETHDAFRALLKGYETPTHRIFGIAGVDSPLTADDADDPELRARFIAHQGDFLDRLWTDTLHRQPVAVAFVDHAPGFLRTPAIGFLADKAEYLVVHDTEWPGHGYEPSLSSFSHRWDFTLHTPHSAVVSNAHDCGRFSFVDPTGGRGLPPLPTPPPPRLPSLWQRLREATKPERRAIVGLLTRRPR